MSISIPYRLPRRRSSLLISALFASSLMPAAYAQQSTQQSTQQSAQQTVASADATAAQAVIVTGTRSVNRTVTDSEAPIDVLTSKDLQATGATDIGSALNRLLPSLNFPSPAVADATSANRPAQLRGLSPDQTLILVNGKRWHTTSVVNVNGTVGRGSSPADLNTIPLSSIDHIEVLRDGAAAQYGSDAIAGVINIILKKGATGGEIALSGGEYSERDGRQGDLSTNFGIHLGEKGWLRFTAEEKNQGTTNRAGADFRNPLEPLYGKITQQQGDPQLAQYNVGINAGLPLNDDIELYTFINASQRNTDAAATWRTAYTTGTTLRSPLYPDGFLPIEAGRNIDFSSVIGVRGHTDGWRWDSSLNYGYNEFTLNVNNTANLSLGAQSPTSFYDGQLRNTQTLFNFDAAREIELAALANPLTVAFGAEYRRDEYQISPGNPNSYSGSGAQGFAGFQPSNSGDYRRHSSAVYADLETDLTKQLSASAAIRHEDYSDFGSVTSGKLSARLAVTKEFALRAAASNGFRAPSLAQENYTITGTNLLTVNGTTQPVDTGTFGVGTAAAKALGAKPLAPEKSKNFSVGGVYQPTNNASLSVDAYEIDIDNRILYSGNLVLPASLQSVLANQGVLVGAARYFTNALDTKTRGVDVVGNYQLSITGSDKVLLTFGYNHNNTSVSNVAANPAILAANNLTLIDRQSILRATASAPKDKLTLAADYIINQWTTHAQVTRYGSFLVPQNNAAQDQTYSANTLLDLAASYHAGKWTITGGINNVTNKYPDQVQSSLNSGGTLPYSTFSPYGFDGRYFYGKVAYNW